MIGSLRGVLLTKLPPANLLLEVQGVGYELEVSSATFQTYTTPGVELLIYTHLLIKDDAHLLYGFASLAERDLFRDLLRVNGVGPKLALSIISNAEPAALAGWIESSNTSALTRLPGVGKKIAERLSLELRERAHSWEGALAATAADRSSQNISEATQALVNLGYRPSEAAELIKLVHKEGLSSEVLIRKALQRAGQFRAKAHADT